MSLSRQILRAPAVLSRCSRLLAAQQQCHRNYADAAPVTSGTKMVFTLASPADMFYKESEEVRQVVVPTLAGQYGILAGHVPCLGALKPGVVEMNLFDGETRKVFVSSGTLTVNSDNSVQILAEEAHDLSCFDPAEVNKHLSEQQQKLDTERDDEVRAICMINLECLTALQRALM